MTSKKTKEQVEKIIEISKEEISAPLAHFEPALKNESTYEVELQDSEEITLDAIQIHQVSPLCDRGLQVNLLIIYNTNYSKIVKVKFAKRYFIKNLSGKVLVMFDGLFYNC